MNCVASDQPYTFLLCNRFFFCYKVRLCPSIPWILEIRGGIIIHTLELWICTKWEGCPNMTLLDCYASILLEISAYAFFCIINFHLIRACAASYKGTAFYEVTKLLKIREYYFYQDHLMVFNQFVSFYL